MTPQYKPGDRVRHKTGGELGHVHEVRKDGTVVVLWEMKSNPWTSGYSPHSVDDYVKPIPGDQPLTDAQVAQVLEVLAGIMEGAGGLSLSRLLLGRADYLRNQTPQQPEPTEPAAPEGDPSRIQVGDTVYWIGRPATVVAVYKNEASILRHDGLRTIRLTHLTKEPAHG